MTASPSRAFPASVRALVGRYPSGSPAGAGTGYPARSTASRTVLAGSTSRTVSSPLVRKACQATSSRQITTSGASERIMFAALIRFARSTAGDGAGTATGPPGDAGASGGQRVAGSSGRLRSCT